MFEIVDTQELAPLGVVAVGNEEVLDVGRKLLRSMEERENHRLRTIKWVLLVLLLKCLL